MVCASLFTPGYQYKSPSYPYLYKMAPVYSWYQRDEKPPPAVEMEPSCEGNSLAKQILKSYSFLGYKKYLLTPERKTNTEGRTMGEGKGAGRRRGRWRGACTQVNLSPLLSFHLRCLKFSCTIGGCTLCVA